MGRLIFHTSLIKFCSLFGAMAFSWLISLTLPIDEAGLLFALLAIVPGVAVWLGFGVDQTILRVGASRFAKRGSCGLREVAGFASRMILKRTIILWVVSSPFLVFTVIFAPEPERVVISTRWLLALVAAPFFATLIPSAMGYRVQGRYARSVLSEPSVSMAVSAIGFFFLQLVFEPHFWLAFSVYLLSLVVMSASLFSSVFAENQESIEHDWYFGATQIAQYLLQWGVVGQVAFFATDSEIAAISLSMRMAMLVNMILILVNTINGNKISQYLQSDRTIALIHLLRKQSFILLFCGCVAACALGVSAPLFYGSLDPDFGIAVVLTNVLIVGQLVNVLVGPSNLMLNMSGNARVTGKITIMTGVPATALVWPVYQLGGIVAVAALISASLAIVSISAAICTAKIVGIRPIFPRKN